MSSKPEIIDAEGHGWRLWTHVLSGPMLAIQVALGCDAYVTVPIPLELARRITGEPEVKLVPVEGTHHNLKPHWVTLMELMLAAGMTSERKASDIASLYADQRTPMPLRGASVALWRRGILGRVPVHPASHYWLTEKGLALVTSSS
jgi:hypothetical protein